MHGIRCFAPSCFGMALAAILLADHSTASAQQGTYIHAPYRTYSSNYRPPATQYPVPTYPSPTFAPRYSTTYAPSVPGYSRNGGYYLPMQGGHGAGYTSHYGYAPARRPLKNFKPWLRRR
ncbi:hypothetical protein P12x_004983 [Tundrisphaera lichenicola]|uniref:hypothetical protein n=1 Tax=Tundrisphaera lichenicola TaxID=2029860 RepID=UPI003EC12891